MNRKFLSVNSYILNPTTINTDTNIQDVLMYFQIFLKKKFKFYAWAKSQPKTMQYEM